MRTNQLSDSEYRAVRVPDARRPSHPYELPTPGVIPVIDDESGIVEFLEQGLRAHGFEVGSEFDRSAAWRGR